MEAKARSASGPRAVRAFKSSSEAKGLRVRSSSSLVAWATGNPCTSCSPRRRDPSDSTRVCQSERAAQTGRTATPWFLASRTTVAGA